jgi:hypothetical protein
MCATADAMDAPPYDASDPEVNIRQVEVRRTDGNGHPRRGMLIRIHDNS